MDPIFLTSRIITNGDKIPTYNVQVELPKDWLLTVLRLQKLYLDNNVGGSLRDFVTTLQMLESIAISNNLIDSNFLDLLCWSATSFTNLYILLINSQITEIYGLQPDMNILIHHREH
ncbi:MAG: hypothetical protein OEZ01_10685, partial [Candidatus Heimdallarchaeota archaeon]|nr:hypothetical protein [Candidatus Heimdallarchaeota archaeon]